MAKSVGELFVEIGADVKEFEKAMQRIQRNMGQAATVMGSTGETISSDFAEHMSDMRHQMRYTQNMFRNWNYENLNSRDLQNLPEHLRSFADSVLDSQRSFKQLANTGTMSLDQISDHVLKTRTDFKNMTSVSKDGKKVISMLNGMLGEAKAVRLAILGLNKDGTVKISTEESQKQIEAYKAKLADAKRQLEAIRDAGDFDTYQAGMRVINRQLLEVNRTMAVVARGGKGLSKELRQLGIVTTSLGDSAAIAMEQMKERFIEANSIMQARTTQSERMIKNLARMDVRGLDQQFLKLGKRLEKVAKSGTATNLALKELGKNASMKDIMDQVNMINQGLMRMQMLQLGMGIGTAAFTYGLVLLSNELDGRLIPAAEKFKEAWSKALAPWIKQWTSAAEAVVNFGTKIGEAVAKFTEAHPIIAGMAGNIFYLTMAFTAILAPLAIGIGRLGSMRAAFSALWMLISPFVVGFLSVAGTALTVATAIVGVTYAVKECWKNSENFRNAVTGLWDGIKAAWSAAIEPVKEKLAELDGAFQGLITNFLGGADTYENRWQAIGDAVAKVINMVAPAIIQGFAFSFETAAAIIIPIIEGLITIFGTMSEWYTQNSEKISQVISQIGTIVSEVFGFISQKLQEVLPLVLEMIMTAFTEVYGFIQEIMPSIKLIVTEGFKLMQEIAQEVFPKILELVQTVFPIIAQIISTLMPIVLFIVESVWGNIKACITSAIDFILAAIDFFSNLFQGNWSALWQNVKDMISNAVTFIWNFLQVMWVGKMVKGVVGAAKALWTGVRGFITNMKNNVVSIFTNTKDFAVKAISNMKTTLLSIWNSVKSGSLSIVNGMKAALSTVWNTIKSIAQTAWDGVKKVILTPIESACSTIMGIVDKIVGAFKGMKIDIPKPKLPKINVGSKKILGVTIPTFGLEWNAKGAIFTKPTVVGNQGFGEAGKEAAIPIQHRRYMKPFSNAIGRYLSDQVPGSQGTAIVNEFNISQLVVREEADIKRIAEELDKIQKQEARARGSFSFA